MLHTFPKVTIIIVLYNGIKWLKNLFESIDKIDYPNFEIICIDNNSQDDSVNFIISNYPKVILIKNYTNMGFAAANNIAVNYAAGKYIFFLNSDTIVEYNILNELVEMYEKDDTIGILSCYTMDYNKNSFLQNGIGLDVFGYPIETNNIFYAEGSALMIKKDIFNYVGRFDSKYFMFHEDIDLA